MNTTQALSRLHEVIRRQDEAPSTEERHTFWLRRYVTALRQIPEGLSSESKLERFLTDLTRHRDLSAVQGPKRWRGMGPNRTPPGRKGGLPMGSTGTVRREIRGSPYSAPG